MVRDTSVKTYYELVDEGFVSDRCQLVYNFLRLNPNLTDTELANGLDFDDPNAVRPRRKDLFDAGLVVSNGKRECAFTGRTCYQWVVVDEVSLRRKEVKVDGFITRTFRSMSMLEAVSLATAYVLQFRNKKYCCQYSNAEHGNDNVFVITVKRKE